MSFLDDLLKANKEAPKPKRRPPSSKMAKRAIKHRLDHSNPGGTVSMYFREKRARI